MPFTLFTVINGGFQGSGDTRPVMYLSILCLWGICVLLAMYLAGSLARGPARIWYAMFVSNIVTAAIGFAILRTGRWLHRIELTPQG